MFVYGVCVGPTAKFTKYAGPSLDRFAAEGAVLLRYQQTSIFAAYKSIIEQAQTLADVEGLVLLHDDVELLEDVSGPLERAFASGFSLVGPVGGAHVPGMTWWHGTPRGRVGRPVGLPAEDHGGGTWTVDALDGLFLALAPDALRHLDLRRGVYPAWHGYDAEIAAQVRQEGGKVGVVPLNMIHHAGLQYDADAYRLAQLAWDVRWAATRTLRAAALGRYAIQRVATLAYLRDRIKR